LWSPQRWQAVTTYHGCANSHGDGAMGSVMQRLPHTADASALQVV